MSEYMKELEINKKQVVTILWKYNINKDNQKVFWQIIDPIFNHPEFQKRMNASIFPHHDNISLGVHIISDAVYTLNLGLKQKLNKKQIKLAVIIAMFHDLYEKTWQNNEDTKKKFINGHALVHPIEAAINACTWFPKYFLDLKQASIIIDGIIHHMWPWPVRAIDKTPLELNNADKYKKLDKKLQDIIIYSSCRLKIGHVSLAKSKFIEGKIMAKADKIISLLKDINFNGIKTVITGKNRKIKK